MFPEYSPRRLWSSTVRLVHTLFHTPPTLTRAPKSYFHATLEAHRAIMKDLTGILSEEPVPETCNETTTIRYVHESLQRIETNLFGTEASECPKTLEGACLRTIELEKRLRTSRGTCTVL